MSLLDDSTALDQTTPWAPTVLAPPPEAAPQPAVKPGKITPETHPGYFNAPAPAAGGAPAGPQLAASASPAAPQPAGGDYMATVRRRESGGNDMAANGAAFGRYQFTQRTWLGVAASHPELGLRPEDIWNGDKQDQAMKALTADNTRVLQKEGLDASGGNLYMMHFLGTGGGPKFLKAMQAEPTANAAAMFPLEAKYNPTIFFHGGDPNQPRNLSQIYGMMTKDFGGTAVEAAQTKSVENSQPQIASDAISDATNDASLPPLPAGAKPIEAASEVAEPGENLPPLPAGAKPITPQDAYEQDVNKGGYEAEATKGVKPPGFWDELSSPEKFFGPGASWSNLGNLIGHATPEQRDAFGKAMGDANSRMLEAEGKFTAGAASGVAQSAIGPFELVPGEMGQRAAEADKTLQQFGSPGSQDVGKVGAMMLPVAKGAEAAGAGVKAFTEAAPWAEKVGEATGWGAIAGAATPTGETDPTKRAEEKLVSTGAGAALSGTVAGGLPLVGKAGEFAGKEAGALFGTTAKKTAAEAKAIAEELRTGVNAETGKVLSEQERIAKLAKIDEMVAKKDLAGHEQELARLEKAQQEVAESERVRAAKGRDAAAADDPEAAAQIKMQVSAQLRDRVRDSERAARAAGQTEIEARTFAIGQEQRLADTEAEAKKLVNSYASQLNIDAKTFGKDLQSTAETLYKKLEKERSEQAGFGKALANAGPEPKVSTSQIDAYLKKAETETANQGTRSIFQHIREELKTRISGSDKPVDVNGLSVRKADSLRKTLESAIRTKQMTVANNAAADASEAAYHLAKVRGMLVNTAREASPEYGQALNKFRELSRPLDIFERKGPLRGVVEKDALSGDFKMQQADVVGAVLRKAKGGSPAFGRLIAENPELKNSARLYFNHQLFGFENAPKTPLVSDFNRFFTNNQEALEQTGLTKDFADLRAARASGEKAIAEAKENVGEAKKAVSAVEPARKAAFDKVVSDRSLSQAAAKREADAAKGLTAPEDIAKSAASRAKEAEQRLKEQAKEPAARAAETQRNISDLASTKAKATTARNKIRSLQITMNEPKNTPAQVVSETKSTADWLRHNELLTDSQYEKFSGDLRDAQKKIAEASTEEAKHKAAVSLAVKIAVYAGLFGTAGEQLIQHRVYLH
jgi:hypothetical protein